MQVMVNVKLILRPADYPAVFAVGVLIIEPRPDAAIISQPADFARQECPRPAIIAEPPALNTRESPAK